LLGGLMMVAVEVEAELVFIAESSTSMPVMERLLLAPGIGGLGGIWLGGEKKAKERCESLEVKKWWLYGILTIK